MLPRLAPVQSTPSKKVNVADVADITGEAKARRAVVTKATLKCIMIVRIWGSCSFYQKKKWSELKVPRQGDEGEAWREGPEC